MQFNCIFVQTDFVAWLMYEACFNNKNFFHVRSRKLILALLQVFLPAKL
jgi:hypothetical protein